MTGYRLRYAEPPEGYHWVPTGKRDPAYSLEKIQTAPRQAPAAQQPLAAPTIAPEVFEVEAGRLPPPAQAAEAAAQTPLNAPQQAMQIGEPIPVVFCRRRNDIGGVLLFPKATEAAFSNNSTQQTARYHCVLGIGPMGSAQVRDFRVGACRVGTFSQNYDQRAGTWTPGNTATVQSGYQVPTFPTATGGGGSYAGLSTLEFSNTTTGGSDDWRLGCNVFQREGLTVSRLLGGSGGSDNFVDLVLWALQRSGRMAASLIDTTSLTDAARFLDVNGLFCNGEFTESANLGDWLLGLLPYFLLRQTGIGGKFGLRPLLPTNDDGTINTDTIAPNWVLTEAVIAPGSFSQQWSDAGTRLAPRMTMLWRQQDETSIPIVRSLIVGLDRTGPAEQHDLSRFCASEIHAARVGAYLHGRRYLSTHSASLTLIPGSHTGRIEQGDVVVVRLPLTTGREADGLISDWYAVESVAPAADGSEALTLSHFPVDSLARSLLALQVAEATAPGILLPFASTGACDLAGRSSDTSVPASTTSGSGSSGAYNFSGLRDRRADGEDAPKSPGVNQSIPGGKVTPKDKPPNPAPGYEDLCPGGFQIVSVQVWGARPMVGGWMEQESIVYATEYGIIAAQTGTMTSFGQPANVYTLDFVGVGAYAGQSSATWNGTSEYPFRMEIIGYSCSGSTGPAITTRRYQVVKGDTLYDIAGKTLGDVNRWPEIYNLNKDKIENPDLIYPGQVLKLPAS